MFSPVEYIDMLGMAKENDCKLIATQLCSKLVLTCMQQKAFVGGRRGGQSCNPMPCAHNRSCNARPDPENISNPAGSKSLAERAIKDQPEKQSRTNLKGTQGPCEGQSLIIPKKHAGPPERQVRTNLKGNDDLLQVVQGEVDELGLSKDGTIYICFAHSL